MAQAPIVGLDIGSQLMKAVELTVSSKEGLAVTGIAVAPTPPDVLQNGLLSDPQTLAQAVRQMLKDAGIRSKRVVGCVAGQASVVVRIIEVPRMTPTELAETMKWEVERHVPFAPTEVQMDYQPLPAQGDDDADNPNMSVLLAVAQRDMVDYYVDMLFRAGLDPRAIDIEPLASGRALLDIENGLPVRRPVAPVALPSGDYATEQDPNEQPARKETVALVNIGATNTDISIFEDGMLIFPRSLALAGESITKAIAEALGYQTDQAERLKIERAQVLLDRVAQFPDQSFPTEPVEFPYGQPEEDFGNLRPVGLPDSGPLSRSPFDSGPLASRSPFEPSAGGQSDRIVSGPLGQSGPLAQSGPLSGAFAQEAAGFNSPLDLERTQPIQRRTLDLARRGGAGPGEPVGGEAQAEGAPDDLTVQIFDAMQPVLSELATELRRSLDYYRSRAAGRNVDRVVLCGGTASLPGLDKFLDQELQVPVTVADPLAGLSVVSRTFDSSYLQTVAPLFAVALGLAARPAVFAANPEPVARKERQARTGGSGRGRLNMTMPNITFGRRGKRGSSGTIPPGS